jgi:predicted nucleic acid-binding protein
MIHLDADILIQATQKNSQVQEKLREWLEQGESFSSSAVAWAEFLNVPLTPQNKRDGEFLIQSRIIPLGRSQAEIAAYLSSIGQSGSAAACLIALLRQRQLKAGARSLHMTVRTSVPSRRLA